MRILKKNLPSVSLLKLILCVQEETKSNSKTDSAQKKEKNVKREASKTPKDKNSGMILLFFFMEIYITLSSRDTQGCSVSSIVVFDVLRISR